MTSLVLVGLIFRVQNGAWTVVNIFFNSISLIDYLEMLQKKIIQKELFTQDDELSGFLKQSYFERTKLCCIITNSDESVDLLLDGL